MTIEEAARTFTHAALAYKQWMQRVAADDKTAPDVRRLFTMLADLQVATVGLPPVRLSDDADAAHASEEAEGRADLEEARSAWNLADKVASKLPIDAYSTVFDALDADDRGSVMKNLSDDLGDIYREVERALTLSEMEPLDDTVWEWRFSYYMH